MAEEITATARRVGTGARNRKLFGTPTALAFGKFQKGMLLSRRQSRKQRLPGRRNASIAILRGDGRIGGRRRVAGTGPFPLAHRASSATEGMTGRDIRSYGN